jgi:hypothetical protein
VWGKLAGEHACKDGERDDQRRESADRPSSAELEHGARGATDRPLRLKSRRRDVRGDGATAHL